VQGLRFPVAFIADPVLPALFYVVEQTGMIRVVQNGTPLPTPFLDLTAVVSKGGEQGLLGLAFSPDYATSRRFFVNFTNLAGDTVIARFTRRPADPFTADPASRFDLMWPSGDRFIVQPYENHNGGTLAFGSDGYLYIGMGDGGSGGDPEHRAQDPNTLLGKMLRIDVNVPDSNAAGFQVPPDNPYLDSIPVSALGPIWSFGLRNPFKFAFDDTALGGTGALIIGDVGQGAREEIDYEPAGRGGRNYGWSIMEGTQPYNTSRPPAYTPLTPPLLDYDRDAGRTVIAGYVYRGTALSALYAGRYFYADFITGRVWSALISTDAGGEGSASQVIDHTAELGSAALLANISSLGVDNDGEIYIVNYGQGRIHKIVPRKLAGRRTPSDFNGDGVADLAVYRAGTWLIRGVGTFQWGLPTDQPVPGDYDGDGRWDVAVFRPSSGLWFVMGQETATWGRAGDIPVPADYDGDGRTDIAVYRPSTRRWFVRNILNEQWGEPNDVPVPGDYDGDGRAEIAVYRRSTGEWLARGLPTVRFGAAGDMPVPADYDGDRRTDIAVFRPSTATWFVRDQFTIQHGMGMPVPMDLTGDGRAELVTFDTTGNQRWLAFDRTGGIGGNAGWGAPGDVPAVSRPRMLASVAADTGGDRQAELVFFRPSTTVWAALTFRDGSSETWQWRFFLSSDVPVASDYDGDGRMDPALFRPASNTWFVFLSGHGFEQQARTFGTSGDLPVPGDYLGTGSSQIAVYRPSSGAWFVADGPTIDMGVTGGTPVAADFDGDGRTDMALYGPSAGQWRVRFSSTGFARQRLHSWGLSDDVPVPGDYDGDGLADPAVFRPSTGRWYILHSSTNFSSWTVEQWGSSGDVPVPGEYIGDGRSYIAFWRPSSGEWFIKDFMTIAFGMAGDRPVLAR
jgi:glucose/arabinose dehydrogenase/putative transposon-encoded protein